MEYSREKTHGRFSTQSQTAQELKELMRGTQWWDTLQPHQREALELIATKISRILNGNPMWQDSWHDIAGYATLVANNLTEEK